MENVRIAMLDKFNNVLGFMDNDAPEALHFFDDTLHTYLKGSAYTFTFTADASHVDSEYLIAGNKLSFRYNDHDYYLNILSAEENEYEIEVEAYGLLFELLNETVGEYSSDGTMTFEQYKEEFDKEGVIKIGNNEISENVAESEWSVEETVLSRFYSLANIFNAEIEFITKLKENYSLDSIVMNVYKKHSGAYQGIGNRRDDVILRYGKDIDGITRTTSIVNLVTAIRPTGKDGITITNLDKKELDLNGDVEFESKNGDIYLKAVQARDRFPSNTNVANDRYISVPWSYDTDSAETLYEKTLERLKELSEPMVTYKVSGYTNLNMGDTVRIIDDEFHPPLYVSARVTEQEISFTDPKLNKTTFNNFIELESQIDDELLEQMRELAEKNKRYNWIVFADDEKGSGISLDPTGKRYMGSAVNRLTEKPDLSDSSVYTWVRVRGDDGESIPGPPGKNGVSSYTHIAYSNSADGTVDFSISDSNREYVGMYVDSNINAGTDPKKYRWSKIKGSDGSDGVPGSPGDDGKTPYLHIAYANSEDGKIGFSVSDSVDKLYMGQYTDFILKDSEDPTKYRWTKIKGDQGDKGDTGDKGDSGIIVSEEEPQNPTDGQLWQTKAGQPIMRWDGTKWVIHYISVENIKAEILSAISANLGTVTAGIIKNDDEYNKIVFDVKNGTIKSINEFGDILVIKNGYISLDGKAPDTNYAGVSITNHDVSFNDQSSEKNIRFSAYDTAHEDILIETMGPDKEEGIFLIENLKKARDRYADGEVLIECGSLPNNGTKLVDTVLPAEATNWWISDAWFTHPNLPNYRYTLPHIDIKAWVNSVSVQMDNSKRIALATTANWSGYNAYVIVAYKR